jgi:hypothetical protein
LRSSFDSGVEYVPQHSRRPSAPDIQRPTSRSGRGVGFWGCRAAVGVDEDLELEKRAAFALGVHELEDALEYGIVGRELKLPARFDLVALQQFVDEERFDLGASLLFSSFVEFAGDGAFVVGTHLRPPIAIRVHRTTGSPGAMQ